MQRRRFSNGTTPFSADTNRANLNQCPARSAAKRNHRSPLLTEPRISTAFHSFFAEANPNEKREAIVVYRAPTPGEPHVRGRLRELKSRLDMIRAGATAPSRRACSRVITKPWVNRNRAIRS
jgi:hypothetical protein